jgi:DNA-binding response OmpR family regulator
MAQNILIIEDDEFLRGLINKKLSSAGFSVSEAIDGDKGVEKAKEDKPDLILLDLLLPTTDGFEVLSKIKNDPETASIPVIALTNLGQKEDVDKALKLGAVDYLIKAQFTPEEIISKIKDILEKK